MSPVVQSEVQLIRYPVMISLARIHKVSNTLPEVLLSLLRMATLMLNPVSSSRGRFDLPLGKQY
jgi:hypothetical protein